ncbi:META domain-containing protein [Chloroflexota bacterium]
MRGSTLRIALLITVATLLAATGCLPDMPGEAPPGDQMEQPPLEDSSWALEAFGQPGNLTPAIAGKEPTIDFDSDELSGSAGCNSYFGSYTSDKYGALEVSQLGNTEMACMEPGVMQQEQFFLDALRLAESYRVVKGKLRVVGGGNLLVLGRPGQTPAPEQTPPTDEEPEEEEPEPEVQPELKNTHWELEAYGEAGSLTMAIPGKEPTLHFETGDMNGHAGCNSYFGSYESDTDGSLEISDVNMTMMYCTDQQVRDQEKAYLDGLQLAETYKVVGDKLRIEGDDILLIFGEGEEEPEPVEQPPLKNTSWELVAYGEPGSLTTPIPGKEPRLEFATSDLSGYGGCNSYHGSYDSDTDGTLEITDIGLTMMYCPGVMEQEHDYLDALSDAEWYEIVGDELHIAGGDSILVFEES